MNPTKKKIKINGRLVMCRALKKGERGKEGAIHLKNPRCMAYKPVLITPIRKGSK